MNINLNDNVNVKMVAEDKNFRRTTRGCGLFTLGLTSKSNGLK
jgi:hypothetical protein